MFDKIFKFLIKKKIIGEFFADIIITTNKENIKVKIETYNEKFPISFIKPKNKVNVKNEKTFTINWKTNKNNTTVMLIVYDNNKEIIHKAIQLKNNEIKEIKI